MQTIRNALHCARVAFEDAIDFGVLAGENPFTGLRVRRSRATSTREAWTVLFPDEQTRALDAVRSVERAMVAFAMGSCLRDGELRSLRLEDVHLEEGDPHVVVRFGGVTLTEPKGLRAEKIGDAYFLPTKSGKPRRISLTGLDLARGALRTWIEALSSYAEHNPLGLVFPRSSGRPRDQAPARIVLRIERAIGRNFRWHDLRHTGATSLYVGWWGDPWPLERVQRLCGHSSLHITERYAHWVEETEVPRKGPNGLEKPMANEKNKELEGMGCPNPCPVEEGVHPWAEDSGSRSEPLPPQEIAPRPADERNALDVTCPGCGARPGAPCTAVDLADARLGREVHAVRIAAGLAYIPPRQEELAKARGASIDDGPRPGDTPLSPPDDEGARPLKVDDVVIHAASGERGIVERHPRASDPEACAGSVLVRFRSGAAWVWCGNLRRAPSDARRTDDGTYPDADERLRFSSARVSLDPAVPFRSREPAPDFSPGVKELILKLLSEEHESGVSVGRADTLAAVDRILTLMIGGADISANHARSETLREVRRELGRLRRGPQ